METIFKWFTDEAMGETYTSWFVNQFIITDFEGINKLLFRVLEFVEKTGCRLTRNSVMAYLSTDGKHDVLEYKIRVSTVDSYDYKDSFALDEAYRIIVSTTLASYDSMLEFDLTDREFKTDMFEYMRTKKAECIQSLLVDNFPRIQAGDSIDQVSLDLQNGLERIDMAYDVNSLDKLSYKRKDNSRMKDKMRFLFKTGVPCLDGATQGVFTKQVHSMSAQPGGGKTRWSIAEYVYPALVAGIGVYYMELELTAFEVENMLIAHHIVNLFGGEIKIPDSSINYNKIDVKQNQYVEAARIDLFESGKFGKFIIDTDEVRVETFTRKLRRIKKDNPDIELIVNDYAGLMKSEPITKYGAKFIGYEVIKEGYQIMKQFAKNADVAFFVLNQFNIDGINAAKQGKTIQPGHTEGGQFIQRHSDYDYAMTMTDEEEIANRRSLSTVKKRAATGFKNVPFLTDLAVSVFKQMKFSSSS